MAGDASNSNFSIQGLICVSIPSGIRHTGT